MIGEFEMMRIKYIWLFVTIAIVITSCSGTRSVRNMKYLRAVAENDKTANSDAPNDNIEFPDLKPIQAKKIKEESADYSKMANIVGSRLPTLREQMDRLSDAQDTMKGDLTAIKQDIEKIKHMISDLSGTLDDYIPEGSKLPMTGGEKRKIATESYINPSNSMKLESDEKYSNELPQNRKIKQSDKQTIVKKAISETYLLSDQKIQQSKPKATNINSEKAKVQAKQIDNGSVENIASDNLLINQGRELFNKRNYLDAISVLKNALINETSKKQETEINYLLGESYYFTSEYSKSIEYMNKVLDNSGNSFVDGARIRKAEANLKSGKIDEAKADYQLLIKNHPLSNHVPKARKMLQQL